MNSIGSICSTTFHIWVDFFKVTYSENNLSYAIMNDVMRVQKQIKHSWVQSKRVEDLQGVFKLLYYIYNVKIWPCTNTIFEKTRIAQSISTLWNYVLNGIGKVTELFMILFDSVIWFRDPYVKNPKPFVFSINICLCKIPVGFLTESNASGLLIWCVLIFFFS